MKIGIDLVYISEFKLRLDKMGGPENVFCEIELEQGKTLESLAGKFAAKEAFIKALGYFCGWHNVWIEKDKNGAPRIYSDLLKPDEEVQVTITHKKDLAIAFVIIQNK